MKYEKVLKEKDYLIKSVIKRLNIYKNYDEFYHLGSIALYDAFINYDKLKDDNNNFDVYAYYSIMNYLKNELTKINKYSKLEMQIDLYENEYLAPIIEDDIIQKLEYEDLFKNLTKIQNYIINYRKSGYKNEEIAKLLGLSKEQVKYQLKLLFNQIRSSLNKININ